VQLREGKMWGALLHRFGLGFTISIINMGNSFELFVLDLLQYRSYELYDIHKCTLFVIEKAVVIGLMRWFRELSNYNVSLQII